MKMITLIAMSAMSIAAAAPALAQDAMMKSASCKKMMKMHPDMMKGDGMMKHDGMMKSGNYATADVARLGRPVEQGRNTRSNRPPPKPTGKPRNEK